MAIELTILMPCLNESRTIAVCINKALCFLQASGVAGEVLIADNGSTDGSQHLARSAGARVIEVVRRGYGAALLAGISAAEGRFVIMGDADDSYDFSTIGLFLTELRSGSHLVIGNRFKGGIENGAMPFLHRYLGNPCLSFLGRSFFKVKIGDFHCGLRGFKLETIRGLGLRTTGMEFASELIVRSSFAGLRISEVPTILYRDGRGRPPHLRTWRDGWRHLKFLLFYSPRWLFVIPGVFLTLIGILFSAILARGAFQFGGIVFDLNTYIVACFSILIGAQLLSFGVLSQVFARAAGMLPAREGILNALRPDHLAATAAIFIFVGSAIFLYMIYRWADLDFGTLADPAIPRFVIFGVTLVAVGVQALFTSFLAGIVMIPMTREASSNAGKL